MSGSETGLPLPPRRKDRLHSAKELRQALRVSRRDQAPARDTDTKMYGNESVEPWRSSSLGGMRRRRSIFTPSLKPLDESSPTQSCFTDEPDHENSPNPVKLPPRMSSFSGIGIWGVDYEAKQAKMHEYLMLLADEELHQKDDTEPPALSLENDDDLGDLKPINFKNKSVSESLDAGDFTASIQLEKHIELWDVNDEFVFVLCSEVYLSCQESVVLDGSPNVCYLAMECHTIHPSRTGRPPMRAYNVNCTSHKIRPDKMTSERGIRVQPLWMPRYPTAESSECGWYFSFWTPIPLWLFLNADTRTFQFSVRLGFGSRACEGTLSAQSLVSISHLRKDRDMVSNRCST